MSLHYPQGRHALGQKKVRRKYPSPPGSNSPLPLRSNACLPQAFEGYFRDPELTARAVTSDGYYRTGDIGEIAPDGTVRVIDRRSNVVKLANGKFVALEALEALYGQCPGVRQVVLVVAPDHNRLVAVVVPLPGAPGAGALHTALVVAAKAHALPGHEVPCGVVLTDAFTAEAGLLTPSLKIRRARVRERYAAAIAEALGPITADPVTQVLLLCGNSDAATAAASAEAPLAALGIDSMALARLSAGLARECGARVPMHVLAGLQTVQDLRAAVDHFQRPTSAPPPSAQHSAALRDLRELRCPAVAAAGRPPGAAPLMGSACDVLVTGATGFCGAHFVRALLCGAPEVRVRCLVRGPDAPGRFWRRLADWGVALSPAQRARICVVEGDLALPDLGVGPAWDGLCADVDAVVHFGAVVNWTLPYAHLRAPNVLGTAEVLRLCGAVRPKPLVYISTASARPDGESVTPAVLQQVRLRGLRDGRLPRLLSPVCRPRWGRGGDCALRADAAHKLKKAVENR